MAKTDQYNDPLPENLIVLDYTFFDPDTLTEAQIDAIENLDWYCFEENKTNHIFVSANELEKVLGVHFDGATPLPFYDGSAPENICPNLKICKIDRVLHRWNETDGFYWA